MTQPLAASVEWRRSSELHRGCRRPKGSARRCPTNKRSSNTKGLFRVLSGRRSQIEFPTVEVDGVDEVLLIAETARRGLDPLNP